MSHIPENPTAIALLLKGNCRLQTYDCIVFHDISKRSLRTQRDGVDGLYSDFRKASDYTNFQNELSPPRTKAHFLLPLS